MRLRLWVGILSLSMFIGGVDAADKVRIRVSNYNISNDGSSAISVDHACRSNCFGYHEDHEGHEGSG